MAIKKRLLIGNPCSRKSTAERLLLNMGSHFMNRFRKLGLVDYSDNDRLTVHSGQLSVVLRD